MGTSASTEQASESTMAYQSQAEGGVTFEQKVVQLAQPNKAIRAACYSLSGHNTKGTDCGSCPYCVSLLPSPPGSAPSEAGSTQDEAAESLDSANNNVISKDDAALTIVRSALGAVIDRVQKDLGFPTDDTSKRASEVFSYNLAAQASFQLHTDWEILPGFNLQATSLKTAVADASGLAGK